MANESEKEQFIKVDKSLMQIKDGRFTKYRQMVLSELLYQYHYFMEKHEIQTYKDGRKYHFYSQQSEIAKKMGSDKKNIGLALKWLEDKGYINYFSGFKPKYIHRATFITINVDFINSKINNAAEEKSIHNKGGNLL